ncbi:MAG: hypothetical protein JWM44_3517 [Bacilli bacterium]|nr:hypothetical protein [Bacilli bacterium]
MKTQDFISKIAPFAVADMMCSKVLASITIAQGILESDSGSSAPSCNLFGIKGKGAAHETKEFVNGQWITIVDGFRCYDTWEGSVNDHSTFLIENGRYTLAGFFIACNNLDYIGAAHALQAAGYATDPNYAAQLINIIQQNGLSKYDKEVVSNLQAIKDLQDKVAKLEAAAQALVKTTPPDWFIKEFGSDEVASLLKDATGDVDFWRNFAVMIRFFNAQKA